MLIIKPFIELRVTYRAIIAFFSMSWMIKFEMSYE